MTCEKVGIGVKGLRAEEVSKRCFGVKSLLGYNRSHANYYLKSAFECVTSFSRKATTFPGDQFADFTTKKQAKKKHEKWQKGVGFSAREGGGKPSIQERGNAIIPP